MIVHALSAAFGGDTQHAVRPMRRAIASDEAEESCVMASRGAKTRNAGSVMPSTVRSAKSHALPSTNLAQPAAR